MRIDTNRLRQYLTEITRNSQELKKIVEQGALAPESIELKAGKYLLIEFGRGDVELLAAPPRQKKRHRGERLHRYDCQRLQRKNHIGKTFPEAEAVFRFPKQPGAPLLDYR